MKRIGSFLALLAVGSLVFSPPTTRAATSQVFDRNFMDVQTPPCGGNEAVALQGSMKMTVGVTFDESGGSHFSMHSNFQGVTGTGMSSGFTYEVPTTMNSNLDLGSANTLTITLTANVRFISHGSAPNFNLHENFHITINANNEITVLFDNFECG